MMMTIHSQVGTVILSLEARRLYGEPTRICNSRSGTGGRAAGVEPSGASNTSPPLARPGRA
jgi:hypothetical protein